jgi:hypothetical protein
MTEFLEPRNILGSRRLHDAKDQCCAAIADRHFNLRDVLAQRERLNQRCQIRRQGAKRCDQHFTMPYVGQIRLVPLAKTGEHPPLFVHVLDAQTGAAPVSPLRPLHWVEHALWRDPPYACKVLEQLPLLGGELRPGREMLQGTAATEAEMLALRHHAIGRG